MKYNKSKLVQQAQEQINKLKDTADKDRQECMRSWLGYKAGLIADAQIYLKELGEWKPTGE